MSDLLKHVLILGLAVPIGIGGYHLAATTAAVSGAGAGEAEAADLPGSSTDYHLGALPIMERDLYWLESKYVERDRLDPDAMFEAALDRVEREFAEVMFQQEPGGRQLHISVGDHTTVMRVGPLDGFAEMAAQLRRVATVLDEHLSPEVDRREVEYALINGILSTLDPHTILMPPEVADEMDVDNKGEFGGLGIEIAISDGALTITQPIPDTPAAAAGLQAEDRIVRIEGESTINMDLSDAVRKLRGRKGEPVTITVMRKSFSAPRDFTIVRDTIKVDPVEGELLEGGVGYVRIKSFHDGVSSELEDLLARFRREVGGSLRGLVLDLRGNPGGYLTEAVEVSDIFLRQGVIVSTVDGGTGRRDEQRATRAGTADDFPMAVLVNGTSASASEIVAGALRNHDRAVIIGERSFGKGSVQNLYNHEDGSRLKLTVAKYLTPGDQSIQSVGIPPDIALQSTIIEPAAADDADPSPTVSLYWREWIEREADLDNVLQEDGHHDHPPAWSLRFLDDPGPAGDEDPQRDWEVGLAREILLSATSARRPDVLASAGPVVERHRAEEAARIEAAMAEIVGIDWTPGPAPADPALEVELGLGDDGVLVAGQPEDIVVRVTNRGPEPVHQLSLLTRSDNPFLDHREIYFGLLEPGQTVEGTTRVRLADGFPSEIDPVTLELRTPEAPDLAHAEALVETVARPGPRFEYQVRVVDDGSGASRGDGDGIPEIGETIDLEVTVTNVGGGPTSEAFARIKNRSGRALDLQVGSIELGHGLTDDGRPCDPAGGPAAAEPDCRRRLLPGESQTGRMTFELRAPPADGPELEPQDDGAWLVDIQVGDNRAYDFAAVQQGGFYEYFQLEERLRLSDRAPLDDAVRRPPLVEVTRQPSLRSTGTGLVISGRVTDDDGLRDVMIYQGDDKVFYRGGGHGETMIPFTLEGRLAPGTNRFVILARDDRGLVATRSLVTWLTPDGDKLEARAIADPHAG
ncbi:MAG: PDZ domain-containing protein [Deltaproteobacteria bacterium]|nr:MAG: PDZ domain-containing protein [Deltaproteobacteria bacterium]